MAFQKTYNGKDSKSYLTEKGATQAIERTAAKVGDGCAYMVAHCSLTNRFVPIILSSKQPVIYAGKGFRTFG